MKNFTRNFFAYPSHRKRVSFFLISDIFIIYISLYLAFLLRFDFAPQEQHTAWFFISLPLFILVKLTINLLFKLYQIAWRFVGIHDLINIGKAVAVSQAVLILIILQPFYMSTFFSIDSPGLIAGFPRSIFIIDGLISFILLAGLRISKRIYMEIFSKQSSGKGAVTVIVGAGSIGEIVVRDMIRQKFADYYPAVFLDDDTDKIGSYINGVRVTGKTDALQETVARVKADAVVIAIPSLNYKNLRRIYDLALKSNVKTIKIVPDIYAQQTPGITTKTLRDINIEDIIGRQNVTIDLKQVEAFLRNKAVLITGAGGSIGSEIAMQVFSFNPEKIILLDTDDTELHNLRMQIKQTYDLQFTNGRTPADKTDFPDNVHFVIADIRDKERIDSVFKKFRPHVVFHAAAYKHVPIMEFNPEEAVKVNIFGTYNLAASSAAYGTEKFIQISTDKAVNPTSIMGATKRVAEYICSAFNANYCGNNNCGKTSFISVRFGNVLGSRGSLLPLFLQQLKYGGPLTVTHKDMKRYFMTIPEAVALVLQASALGRGGEIMVLDMGEPRKITELAEELIKIHGLRPYEDIEIKFTGIRPGENIFEEILTADETATKHEKIFVVKNTSKYSLAETEEMLNEFHDVMRDNVINSAPVRALLKKHAGNINNFR